MHGTKGSNECDYYVVFKVKTMIDNWFSTSPNKDPKAKDRWNEVEPYQRYRNAFAKDRDRVLYSKGFLRLRDKTQVFMMEDIDYIRTRLTHTLEVSQIARSIATSMCLNLDLTEAIALGHDVGHTPFGHVGERTLDEFTKGVHNLHDRHGNPIVIPVNQQGFKHNLQSARVLCELEPGTEGKGLNLTKYTLWGIINHSSVRKTKDDGTVIEYPYYQNYIDSLDPYWSFEGFVVALADEIAQRHHDIEDSLRYNLISREQLLDAFAGLKLSEANKRNFDNLKKAEKGELSQFVALFSRFLVNMYVVDAVTQGKNNLKQLSVDYGINNLSDYIAKHSEIPAGRRETAISFSPQIKDFDKGFQKLLKDSVINSYAAQALDGKGSYIIRKLFKAYFTNPAQMQDSAVKSFFRLIRQDYDRSRIMDVLDGNEVDLIRVIADYIAGMTDNFAYEQFDLLFGTRR